MDSPSQFECRVLKSFGSCVFQTCVFSKHQLASVPLPGYGILFPSQYILRLFLFLLSLFIGCMTLLQFPGTLNHVFLNNFKQLWLFH